MGTLASLQKLYNNIVKSNAEMSPAEVRTETERYASNVTTGIRTTEGLYTLFDNAFAGSPNVRRFSGAERTRRKAISAKVRQAMTGYISTHADEKSTMPEAEPWLQNFLVPTGHTANAGVYQEQNEKRLIEFQPDTDAFREYMENDYLPAVQRTYPDKNPDEVKAQATQELQKMRGDFTETLVVISARVMENLDTMLDPSLPPDKLSENIAKIMRAKRINDCMETYLEKANNGFMTVRDDIKAMMEQQIKLRPRLTMAVNKLEAMANPMYEYFDVERLGAYDVSAIRKVWEKKLLPNEAQSWREKQSRKHSHFNQYVTEDVQDSFTSFLENAASYSEAKQKLSRQQLQEAMKEYGFVPQESHCFRETPSTEDSAAKKKQMQKTGATHTLDNRKNLHLYQDAPIVYYRVEKAVIFTPADTLTGLTTSRPEELYNYSFVGTTANLAKELDDADRWYKTNKHGYETMRKQLAKITKMGKLPKNFNQNDIKKRKEAYQALLQSSTAYLQSKGVANLNENAQARDAQNRDAVELARIAAARRAKNFADMKMRELDLITNAKILEIRRKRWPRENDNQINAAPANGDDNQINAAPANGNIGDDFMVEDHPELRANNPVRRLHQRYSKDFAKENRLPEPLAKMLEASLDELEWSWDHDVLGEKNLQRQSNDYCEAYEYALGSIAAVEMVLAERKRMGGTGGPMERFFAGADKKLYSTLGYHAASSFQDDKANVLEKAKTVLQEFNPDDPRFEMARYINWTTALHAPMFQQDVDVHYRSNLHPTGEPQRDNALRQFVQTYILNDLDKRIEQGFLEKCPQSEYRDYLAACVAHDAVLLERGNDPTKGPGALEQQMMNAPEKLIEDIKNSKQFKSKLDVKVRRQQKIHEILSNAGMQNMAKNFIQDHNQKIRDAQNEQKKEMVGQGLEAGQAPKAEPKNEEPKPKRRKFKPV